MSSPSSDRRRFLKHLAGGAVAAAFAPRLVDPRFLFAAGRAPEPLASPPPSGPDESYWEQVRAQFPLRDGLILMNAANLTPSPYAVQRTLFDYARDVDADASFQNRGKFSDLAEEARKKLADHLGADPGEIAIVRNTSEANNTVVAGQDLGPGDEVVLWDQNHPTNNISWDIRAQRYGFKVRRVTTPPDPEGPDDLVSPFLDAFTPSTRFLSFSHVSNISGVALPAKELCSEARGRGIRVLVDGAQSFGVLHVNLHDLGCDYYTGSVDKWPMGPEETGLLYVRADRVEDLWPEIVGVGWESAVKGGTAQKFETLGQRDDAAVAAVATTMDFHRTIGADVVEARARQLAAAVKSKLRDRVPQIRFYTPEKADLSAGIVIFTTPGMDRRQVFGKLYQDHDVGSAPEGDPFPGIRLSPHVYNTLAQVDRVADAVAAVV